MRVQHAKKGFGNLRELILQLLADTGGEVSEGLNQSLDVRVLAGVRAEAETRRNLGKFLGKLGRLVPDEEQLVFVVTQQLGAHRSAPWTSKSPVASLRTE